MKANELRIGNLVQTNKGNIVHLNTNHLTILCYGIEDLIKPILLTEEWLLMFRFENVVVDKRKFCGVYFFNGVRLTLSNSGKIYYGKLLISSIHQLQNLYFALTGEELTIKL